MEKSIHLHLCMVDIIRNTQKNEKIKKKQQDRKKSSHSERYDCDFDQWFFHSQKKQSEHTNKKANIDRIKCQQNAPNNINTYMKKKIEMDWVKCVPIAIAMAMARAFFTLCGVHLRIVYARLIFFHSPHSHSILNCQHLLASAFRCSIFVGVIGIVVVAVFFLSLSFYNSSMLHRRIDGIL